jgi:guanylate kinase
MAKKELAVVFFGPSGVGKDSVLQGLVTKYPKAYEKFANMTTRAMRAGEVSGRSYHFITHDEFMEKIKSGEVFEHTHHYDNYYGMSKNAIDNITKTGKVAVNTCDIVGIREIKKLYKDGVLTILVSAPRDIVKARLAGRGDSMEEQEKRLADYDEVMSHAHELDFKVENIELEKAVDEVHDFITNYINN